MARRFRAPFCASLLTLASLGACDGGTGPEVRLFSEPVNASNGQLGTVGEVLPAPIQLLVLAESGEPRAGVVVSWSAADGAGNISPATSTTGADGVADATWTLGTGAGLQEVSAEVDGADPSTVVFRARGLAAAARTMAIHRPEGSGPIAVGRTLALRAEASDEFGNVVDRRAPVWRSLDPSVVDVSGSGIVGALGPGSGRVEARLDAVADTFVVEVESDGLFDRYVAIATGSIDAVDASLLDGGSYSCAVRASGGIDCWGYNLKGQLGTGSIVPSSVPTPVRPPTGVRFADVKTGRGSSHLSCALTTEGEVYCWGASALGSSPLRQSSTPSRVESPTGIRAEALAVGENHACLLDDAGGVQCWGEGSEGRLGNGTETDSGTPVEVALPTGVRATALVAAATATCILDTEGRVLCWGENSDGQLGTGDTLDSSVPVAAAGQGLPAFVSLGAGTSHVCGLTAAGEAYCWGRNHGGQLGSDSSGADVLLPTPIADASSYDLVSISGGTGHTCAADRGGAVRCWGQNTYGQLGIGSLTSRSEPTPVVAPPGVTFEGVAATGAHTCARTAGGEVYCWGQNKNGQLGDGSTSDSSIPERIKETS